MAVLSSTLRDEASSWKSKSREEDVGTAESDGDRRHLRLDAQETGVLSIDPLPEASSLLLLLHSLKLLLCCCCWLEQRRERAMHETENRRIQ